MTTTADIRKRAAADAERIRAEFWDGRFPVDPVRIARDMGIEVLDSKMPENVSGAIHKKEGEARVVIYLSEKDHANRKRFTCAHELGHYVDNADKGVIEYVDYRGLAPQNQAEQYANEFAAYLLMPEREIQALKAKLGNNPKGIDLIVDSKKYGVSADALKYHLGKC